MIKNWVNFGLTELTKIIQLVHFWLGHSDSVNFLGFQKFLTELTEHPYSLVVYLKGLW